MLIGYFTERPYQDPQTGFFGATGLDLTDLDASELSLRPAGRGRSSTTATSTRRSTPRRWASTR